MFCKWFMCFLVCSKPCSWLYSCTYLVLKDIVCFFSVVVRYTPAIFCPGSKIFFKYVYVFLPLCFLKWDLWVFGVILSDS
uniref:Secreted protein n=1 Tax=Pyxicephalus adspersus TaxID=30357 RepID=A0AAV2ZU36_PYXAD|nr:TPA: hypothetical protein GDO54_002910 [Pyxicephalus adspersus]